MNEDIITRINERIVINESGCHIWLGARDYDGYGRISFNRRNTLVHRLVYQIYKGSIKYSIDHICNVRFCVNPEHLQDIPHRDNLLRSTTNIAYINSHKTRCLNGHILEGDNLESYSSRHGKRKCMICRRKRDSQ